MAHSAQGLMAVLLIASLLLLATAPCAARASRALHQIDGSIRQESAHFKILSALRRSGGTADDALGSGFRADLGSQNFEKRSSWRTMNNVRSTLQRYAKPTDGGLRGEVASRYHAKREGNDSGDLEDSNYYLEQAGQKSMRVMMVQADRERQEAAQEAQEAATAATGAAGATVAGTGGGK